MARERYDHNNIIVMVSINMGLFKDSFHIAKGFYSMDSALAHAARHHNILLPRQRVSVQFR